MRAQLLSAFGAPDVFTLAEAPAPVPTRGQLRVRIAAIGINSLETKIRAGQLNEHFPISLPAILGKEFAGTVEWSPDGGGEFAVGDRVAGFADTGVYAEYALARPEALARVPDALTLEQAAALPVAVETATRGIAALEVQPGWTVVVNGATGNVGSAAVQLLAAQGMTVIGTASARNLAYLAALGAVPVAYGEGVATRLRAAAPAGIDAVFDVAGHGFVPTATSSPVIPHVSSPSRTSLPPHSASGCQPGARGRHPPHSRLPWKRPRLAPSGSPSPACFRWKTWRWRTSWSKRAMCAAR